MYSNCDFILYQLFGVSYRFALGYDNIIVSYCAITLSITTLRIMALSIKGLIELFSINDTQNDNTAIMLSFIMLCKILFFVTLNVVMLIIVMQDNLC